jgi:hypothetical protein
MVINIFLIWLWLGQLSPHGGRFSTNFGRSGEVSTPEPPPELRRLFSGFFFFFTRSIAMPSLVH